MNLLRNEKVLVDGRPMVVTEWNRDGEMVAIAPQGWDGETSGTLVPTSKVIPLERMTSDEVAEFIDALPARQLIEALHFMTGGAPHLLVEYGRSFQAERLPERLRPAAKQDARDVLAAFEDVDGGDDRG